MKKPSPLTVRLTGGLMSTLKFRLLMTVLSPVSGSSPLAGTVPSGVFASMVVMESVPVMVPSKPAETVTDSASTAASRSARSVEPDSVQLPPPLSVRIAVPA